MHLVVILLYCVHQNVSASHVVVFMSVRTGIQMYDMMKRYIC